MEIPTEFLGFRSGIGSTVPNEHFVARLIPDVPAYARWLDQRYRRVFLNSNFDAEAIRRERLSRQLASPSEFGAADAEVQTAATVLRSSDARICAGAEGGGRAADYVVTLGRSIDVEVRVLREGEAERELDEVLGSIQRRLEAAGLPAELIVQLHVNTVRRDDHPGRALNARAEARFVAEICTAAAQGRWRTQAERVTLSASGTPSRCTPTTTYGGELASATLKPRPGLARGVVLSTAGLLGCTDEERVYQALKKKGARKQRTDDRPWVIALDTSNSLLFDRTAMETGARRRFEGTTGNLSAVVIQRRMLSLDGLGLAPEDAPRASFQSFVVTNPGAINPLTSDEAKLFEEYDTQLL